MAVKVTWLGHASFRIAGSETVYIDPWKLVESPKDGDLCLISHGHYDHCSKEDVLKAIRPDAPVLGSTDAIETIGRGVATTANQVHQLGAVRVETVAAYNRRKDFHPRENDWMGFLVVLDDVRIYYAGDTDAIEEMAGLGQVDLALLPVGGTYTLGPVEAAQACAEFDPALAVPYHWGDVIGSRADAERFVANAACDAELLEVGASIHVG